MPLSLSLSRSPCACVAFLADRRVVYVVGDHTRVAGALHVPPGACGRAPTPSLCYDVTKPSGYPARAACACARTRVPVLRYRFRIRQSRKCRLETLSCSPTTRVLQATPRGLAAVRAKQPTTLSVCFIDTRCDNSCVLTTLIGWLVGWFRSLVPPFSCTHIQRTILRGSRARRSGTTHSAMICRPMSKRAAPAPAVAACPDTPRPTSTIKCRPPTRPTRPHPSIRPTTCC